LCPKTPFKKAGTLIEPAMSEPIPITEAPAPSNAPLNKNLFKYFFFLFKTYYFKQKLYTLYIFYLSDILDYKLMSLSRDGASKFEKGKFSRRKSLMSIMSDNVIFA